MAKDSCSTNKTQRSVSKKLASFDKYEGIERSLYTGKWITPQFAGKRKPISYGQQYWTEIKRSQYTTRGPMKYVVSDIMQNYDSSCDNDDDKHYILDLSLGVLFPQVKLKNTEDSVAYNVAFGTDPSTLVYEDLYFYLATGEEPNLVRGTVYVGTAGTLVNSLNLDVNQLSLLTNHTPRRAVGWGHYTLLGAIDELRFGTEGSYEKMDKYAIYSDLRTKVDSGKQNSLYQSVSMDARFTRAAIGSASPTTLGHPNESSRYKFTTIPFSISDSSFAIKGQAGRHKSALFLRKCKKYGLYLNVSLIKDPKDLLVLYEEQMISYKDSPLVFVSDPSVVTDHMYISTGKSTYKISNTSFTPVPGTTYYSTQGNDITINDINVGSNITGESLGINYLEQSEDFRPVTKTPDLDYSQWIENTDLKLETKVFGHFGTVTEHEVCIMNADCSTEHWYYNKYYYNSKLAKPETNVDLKYKQNQALTYVKYGYLMALNMNSYKQGNMFNFTNDTEYDIIQDPHSNFAYMKFKGDHSIKSIKTKIDNSLELDVPIGFYNSVTNMLFSNNNPDDGVVVVPKYQNVQLSYDPDGFANLDCVDYTISTALEGSGINDSANSVDYGKHTTNEYKVIHIMVCLKQGEL